MGDARLLLLTTVFYCLVYYFQHPATRIQSAKRQHHFSPYAIPKATSIGTYVFS